MTAFFIVFFAGMVAYGYDEHSDGQRLKERRRGDAIICAYINDTRGDMRLIIEDFTSAEPDHPGPVLPPALQEMIERDRERTREVAMNAIRSLADYDCMAFIEGRPPDRPSQVRP